MNKIFAIGDIHGCLEKLSSLIMNIGADPRKDTLIFIGDYIDRGNSNRETVDYVLRLKSEYRNIVCLLGNHEHMLMRYLEGADEDLYLENGGSATLNSYGIFLSDDIKKRKAKITSEHRKFFKSLLPYYETEDYIFVHAGLKPGLPLKEQITRDLLWIRYEFIDAQDDFGKMVIFGHTPFAYPLIMPNKIGIDTGVIYGGKLTCVELPAVKIHQV
ncbi:MAG: metallophosphoesterase family protein [Deltaproteobacteria bacterium]|nr:metallophosphoesterase family protein [Deltaproteobacteria bacterium]